MKEAYTLKEIEEKLEHEKYLRKENQELYEELQKKEAMYDSLAVDYRLSQEENERLKNVIKELKAILKSKGYETYISVLEGSEKE